MTCLGHGDARKNKKTDGNKGCANFTSEGGRSFVLKEDAVSVLFA